MLGGVESPLRKLDRPVIVHSAVALFLSLEHLQVMQAHAENAYPEECCGLLLGQLEADNAIVWSVRATANAWNAQVADEQTALDGSTTNFTNANRYWIAPAELLAGMRDARSHGCDIVGIYHSHPDYPAVPSECDRRMAWHQYSYLILAVEHGMAKAYKSWKLDEQHQFQAENVCITELAIAGLTAKPSSTARFSNAPSFNAPSETPC